MGMLPTINIFNRRATVCVRQPHGLHMRPAGAIARLTRDIKQPLYFSCKNSGWQNVRNSLMSILIMNIQEGAKLKIKASRKFPKDIFNKIVKIVTSDDINECTQYIK